MMFVLPWLRSLVYLMGFSLEKSLGIIILDKFFHIAFFLLKEKNNPSQQFTAYPLFLIHR